MEFFETVKTRRSIRKFKPGAIPAKKLKSILEAARLAPSAGNRQPWHFVVVKDAKRKRSVAELANNHMFLADASIIIAAIGNPEESTRWYDKDLMIATEHIVLAATALGYGTCWIGAFDEEAVKNLLKIPGDMRVIALLPIGVPNEIPLAKPRKEFAEVFSKDEYGNPLEKK